MNKAISVIISFVVFLLSFMSLYTESSDFEYQSYVRINQETQEEEVVDVRKINSYDDLMKQMATDYFNVKSVNDDAVGFLNIPNIGYYPVVMGSDNQYYLTHNEYKENKSAGIPFMNTACEGTWDDIALLHGHKMRSGAMFGALYNYKDENFFKTNSPIAVFDGEYLYIYKPFSVFVYEDGKGIVHGEKLPKNARKEYMTEIAGNSMIQPTEEYDLTNQVLFLSTCDYTFDNARLLVASVMVEKIKYEE